MFREKKRNKVKGNQKTLDRQRVQQRVLKKKIKFLKNKNKI